MRSAESFPERVERLFHEALELPAEARGDFLAKACEGDAKLLEAVERLLQAAGRVKGKPAWNFAAMENEARELSKEPGDTVLERYRLIERIGSGGMGVVYKALRADEEFSKLVAIKIVQHGADELGHEAVLQRFRQERQILASLEHPNIARLLDGGSTPDGLPFLAMEFVEGAPIDRYLSERKATEKEILEIFRTLCSAVSYAHQKLVVHRDLKPANILVTAEGTPKLLDFGIAKLLDGSGEKTSPGAGALTPVYASPEQVRGEAITTATDVYTLGVLLYELLSGARPYRATGSALEIAQAICMEIPAPMASRAGRRISPDLENIVQKALRKEMDRRYVSVEQFSEDIRKYLDGYPVMARADTRGYRVRKFAGRNKTAIGVGALIAITVLSGTGAIAWQAHLANERFQDVRELADAYLFEFHDAIRDLPGATPARQLVVRRGIQYLDKLARQRGKDDSLSRDLGKAYLRVGSVQGAPNTPSLGDRAGALVSYRKALALLEPLALKAPQNEETGDDLSDAYRSIAELLQYSGDLNGAATSYRKSLALLTRLAGTRPYAVEVRRRLADTEMFLGSLLGNNEISNLGDTKGAMELSQKSRVLLETLAKERPADRELRASLSSIYQRLAAMDQALDNKDKAIEWFRRCVPVDEELIREEPLNVIYRRQSAITNRSLALILLRTGDLAEARQRSDRSAELFGQLAKEDPANMEAQEALADSQYSQGYVLQKGNDFEGARRNYEASLATYRAEMAKHPETLPAGLRTVYQLMADLGIKTGDAPLALRNASEELEIDKRLLAANAHNASAQRNQGTAYGQMGQTHELLARSKSGSRADRGREWREARGWHQRALDVWVQLKKEGVLIPAYAPRLDEAARNVANCERQMRDN